MRGNLTFFTLHNHTTVPIRSTAKWHSMLYAGLCTKIYVSTWMGQHGLDSTGSEKGQAAGYMDTAINKKKTAINFGFHKSWGTALLPVELLASKGSLWSLALRRH